MKELLIFGGLICIIMTLLILVLMPSPFGSPSGQLKGPYNLNSENILFTNSTFIENTSVTFQGFLYLEKVQKTSTVTSCSSTDPSLPNCDSGRYSLCSCVGNDCSTCKHQGYIPIINFNNICTLEVLGAPDGSRQGKAAVQFTMKTQSSGALIDASHNPINPELHPKDPSGNSTSSDIYIETFVLPPLPFQKWVMLTISREGRRYDFFYDNVLVLSKQSSTVLYNSLSGNVTIGNSNLNGSSAYFSIYPKKQSINDITSQYKSFTDTRGNPLLDDTPLSLGLNNIALNPSVCAGSSMNPSTPPAQPFYEWSSSYA